MAVLCAQFCCEPKTALRNEVLKQTSPSHSSSPPADYKPKSLQGPVRLSIISPYHPLGYFSALILEFSYLRSTVCLRAFYWLFPLSGMFFLKTSA